MTFMPAGLPGTVRQFFMIISILLPVDLQAQAVIKGIVADTANKPLAFVSAELLQDSTFISGTTTDESGLFSFGNQLKKAKQYSVHLSLIGYIDTTFKVLSNDAPAFTHIVLQKDSKTMSLVTVTSRTPLVSRKSDRYIINVEKSFLSEGLSGLEVLQKSPGIWVNTDGTIHIRGNQPVRVMIDDMVIQMSGEELSIYLSSLKSEDIGSIEVIPNPPAEYEAAGSGGIIRIVLKKGRSGLNGSANIQYRYRKDYPLYNAGTSLNAKLKNVYLNGSYAFRKDERFIRESTSIDHPDKSVFQNGSDRLEDFTSHQFRMGMSAELGKSQGLGVETVWSAVDIQQDFFNRVQYHTANNNISGIATTNKKRRFRNGSATLNYSWKTDTLGSSFKIIAGYSNNNKLDTQLNKELYSDSILPATYRYRLPFTTEIYNAQADYMKKQDNNTTLTAGIKYASITRDNTVHREDYTGNNWTENAGAGNRFIYREQLLMAYAAFEKKLKAFTIKGGLRFERTISNGNSVTSSQQFSKNYGGLFPSLFLQHFLNEKTGSSIYLNYSRRLSRPSLNDLNPYRFFYTNYITTTGNPEILPEYAHNFSAGIVLLNDYAADFYFIRTKNVITLSARQGFDNTLDYVSENVDGSTAIGVSLSAPFTILPGWRINNNAAFERLYYTFENEKVKQSTYSVKSINTISLKDIVDIDLVSEYQSPHRYSNIYTAAIFYADLGLSKTIVKNKADLKIMFTDMFNSMREKEITTTRNSRIDFSRKRQTRSLQLSFTYHFKSGNKFRSNQIDEGNREETRRSGN